MTEQVSPLATFYKPGWENYQHALVQTIAPLSSEQLALFLVPHQRSIGELLDHMIGARFNWFHLWMGEGDPNLDWNDDEDTDEPTVYKADLIPHGVTMSHFQRASGVNLPSGDADLRTDSR